MSMISRIDWSVIRPRSFLGRALRLPLRLLPETTIVRVRSGPNRGMKWIVGSAIHGCWLGFYELQKQQRVATFVKPGMNVLDIGAHAGYYSLAFSRWVGPHGRVWAFEPHAQNAAHLLAHLRLNGITNVTITQAAVADRATLVGFDTGADPSLAKIVDPCSLMVPAVSLDGLLADGFIPVPDLVKMDVEGAEARVLAGARRILEMRRTIWFIARHGSEARTRSHHLLRSSGYTIHCVDPDRHDPEATDEIYATPG